MQQMQQMQQMRQSTRNNKRISFINGGILEDVKELMENGNKKINASLEKAEKIDKDEIVNYFNNIIEKISGYNESLDSWYDKTYHDDVGKLFEQIDREDKHFEQFAQTDFISIILDNE